MTIQDMICLADMWINLSNNPDRLSPKTLVLPGNLTGRETDRYFSCRELPGMPHYQSKGTYEDHLHCAVDYIDFMEVSMSQFGVVNAFDKGEKDD